MEIKTCEQYVLAELEAARREIETLKAKVAELEAKENLTLDAYCIDHGKRKLADGVVRTWLCSVVQDGEIVPYDQWARSVVRGDDVPPITTKRELTAYLKPYLRSIYDEEVSKHLKEVEDDGR